jgi:hypothetical protein
MRRGPRTACYLHRVHKLQITKGMESTALSAHNVKITSDSADVKICSEGAVRTRMAAAILRSGDDAGHGIDNVLA